MADYQEYRRRVLRKRWRRRFMATALLLLLLLVGAIGMLWKSLHREQRPSGVGQNTILQEVTQDNTWNTASYAVARQLTVQTLADGAATALDFRMAALPKSSTAVGKEWFNDVSFVGDSLTQGMQLYEEGMQNAMFCAYKGVGPNVIVNGTTCKRADGVADHAHRRDRATSRSGPGQGLETPSPLEMPARSHGADAQDQQYLWRSQRSPFQSRPECARTSTAETSQPQPNSE